MLRHSQAASGLLDLPSGKCRRSVDSGKASYVLATVELAGVSRPQSLESSPDCVRSIGSGLTAPVDRGVLSGSCEYLPSAVL